MHINLDL